MSAMLRKELLLHWRGRGQFAATLAFGVMTLLLFSFAVGPAAQVLRQYAGGFLWLAILLASTLSLGESFRVENEHHALEGTLLLPVREATFFYAKALATAAQLTLLGWLLLPFMVVLYDGGTARIGMLLLTVVLGAAGIAGPGTIHSAIAGSTRDRHVLLPLLLFPLLVPLLLAAVKVTSLLILGDPMGQVGDWMMLLISFDVIYWAICGVLIGRVLEE